MYKIQTREADQRKNWFKNHVAKLSYHWPQPADGTRIETLDWRQPDNSNYAMRYMIVDGLLVVTGDLGCAAYQWSGTLSFATLATYDFYYFMEKCIASEMGRRFQMWDDKTAIEKLKEHLIEINEGKPHPSINRFIESARSSACNKTEFNHFLYTDPINFARINDPDHTLSDVGLIPHVRCTGHWLGIKMAMEQLKFNQDLELARIAGEQSRK